MEFFSPGFWTFAGIAFVALSGGVGFLVKYGLNSRDREIEKQYQINQELREENREQHLALERITEDYKQTFRDLVSARLRDAFDERG